MRRVAPRLPPAMVRLASRVLWRKARCQHIMPELPTEHDDWRELTTMGCCVGHPSHGGLCSSGLRQSRTRVLAAQSIYCELNRLGYGLLWMPAGSYGLTAQYCITYRASEKT